MAFEAGKQKPLWQPIEEDMLAVTAGSVSIIKRVWICTEVEETDLTLCNWQYMMSWCCLPWATFGELISAGV